MFDSTAGRYMPSLLHSSAPNASSRSVDKRRDNISVTQPRVDHADRGATFHHQVAPRIDTDHNDNSEKQMGKLRSTSEGYDSMTQVYAFTNLRRRQEDSAGTDGSVSVVADTKSLDTPIDDSEEHQDVVVSPRKPACHQGEPPAVDASHVDVGCTPRTSSPAEMPTLTNERDARATVSPSAMVCMCR